MSEQLKIARSLLEKRAKTGLTLTYREFALALGIVEPPIIRQCVDILEKLMFEDVKENRPILSSLVVQQGSMGIPRLGFYQVLSHLAQYSGDNTIRWHKLEMDKLKRYYS